MQIVLLLSWLLQGALLLASLLLAAPHFGFAPALSMAVWLAVLIYAVEERAYPALKMRLGMLFALFCVLLSTALSLLFPGTALEQSTSPLLPLHWVLGMVSYALFGLALVHATQWWQRENQIKEASQMANAVTGLPLLTLERLMFNFVIVGFVLLSATLVLGLGFREQLYGPSHILKWDHKTIFSIVSWLIFAALLLGRYLLGWRGKKAVRLLWAGTLLLLFSYVGSRFVLEVILHRV